jgi:hypothetical protein
MDEYAAQQVLRLLKERWDEHYKIRRKDGAWHAKRRSNGSQFRAVSPEQLNLDLIRDFMGDMEYALGATRNLDATQGLALDQVRRKHCFTWDHIGPDADSPGWRASRQIKPNVTHHVVTRTIEELDRELDAIAAPGDDEAPVT